MSPRLYDKLHRGAVQVILGISFIGFGLTGWAVVQILSRNRSMLELDKNRPVKPSVK